MEKASRVMYSIANFFTWVVVLFSIAGIVICSLMIAKVIPAEGEIAQYANVAGIVLFAIILIVSIVTIAMVRRAKAKDSSKGWDVLFIVLGVLGWNIFYILGGIFGLVAPRK
jgi:uncharacterized membrane protein